MKRTKLSDRHLPDYTRGEEIMNMVTHIVGGAMGIAVLTLCVIRAALNGNIYGIVTSANEASCRFHEAVGYRQIACFQRSGYKFGKWHDVSWYCLRFEENDPSKGAPMKFDLNE